MMHNVKVGLVSLGCPKNKVDAEVMLKRVVDAGYVFEQELEKCDAVIINTCGFIKSAKEEAIEEIFNIVNLKEEGKVKKILVTGCFSKRYPEELFKDIKEVDAVLGITQYNEIEKYLDRLFKEEKRILDTNTDINIISSANRISTTSPHRSDIKIAEGCSNCCTYCAIPSIRGVYRSRSEDSILDEASKMIKNGVKEITLIAQDTTRYGEDLKETNLNILLEKVAQLDNDVWIRFLYGYPEMITKELVNTISKLDNICNYIDMPLQHINDTILKKMNRRSDRELIEMKYRMIKAINPDIALRTTFITGFPGETEMHFDELYQFIQDYPFNHMGAFSFSPEEGTPAHDMIDQVEIEIADERRDKLMKKQMDISKGLLEKNIGTIQKALLEDFSIDGYIGRTQHMTTDIDGIIKIKDNNDLIPGEFYHCKITDCTHYDLIGEVT